MKTLIDINMNKRKEDMSIEAMKQALEALEANLGNWAAKTKAIPIIKQAIAEAEKQEPAALPCCGYANAEAVKWNPHNQVVQCHNCGHIYTPQRQWVGLDDEEIKASHPYSITRDKGCFHAGALWAQSQLKEKNT